MDFLRLFKQKSEEFSNYRKFTLPAKNLMDNLLKNQDIGQDIKINYLEPNKAAFTKELEEFFKFLHDNDIKGKTEIIEQTRVLSTKIFEKIIAVSEELRSNQSYDVISNAISSAVHEFKDIITTSGLSRIFGQ